MRVKKTVDKRHPDLHLVGEKAMPIDPTHRASTTDPVVSAVIAKTSGLAYRHLVGREFDYPIPDIRLPHSKEKLLLDIGCGWGRWSIAAARKGYKVVGIDPSLRLVMAAKRVAKQLNLTIDYACADALHLPFEDNRFDVVFSYSVIQHFSKVDAARALEEIGRILKPGGHCLIQMPNRLGVRSLLNLCRRRFAEGSRFDVRYWSIKELRRTFERLIGPSEISVHCYFGLGLEVTDMYLMPRGIRLAINMSEYLRKLSAQAPWLTNLADSVYIASVKRR